MESVVPLLPERPQPFWVRIFWMAAIMAALSVFQYSLYHYTGFGGFFVLLPGIFACGFLFDRGTGILAAATGVALTAYVTASAAFTAQTAVLILFFALVCLSTALVSEALRKALDRLAASEKSKDILYRELSHRTKNNLMNACALLTLQARAATIPQLTEGLQVASDRLRVVADIHSYLDAGGRLGIVDVRTYLTDVCEKVGHSMRGSRPLAVEVQADDLELPQQNALALAMVVNEAITNCFKYAFPDDRPGRICVTLRNSDDITVCIEDNGVGCGASARPGLGTRLMHMMSQQLGAMLSRETASPNGCRVVLRIPKDRI